MFKKKLNEIQSEEGKVISGAGCVKLETLITVLTSAILLFKAWHINHKSTGNALAHQL